MKTEAPVRSQLQYTQIAGVKIRLILNTNRKNVSLYTLSVTTFTKVLSHFALTHI